MNDRSGRRSRVTGIVLAGGRSSRFGGDKLAAEIAGATLLDRAIQALVHVANVVIVAGRSIETAARPVVDAGALNSTTIRFAGDPVPFEGPLAALAGVLPEIGTDLALVVGGDMPALVPDVLSLMADRLRQTPGVDAITLAADSPKLQVLPLALRVAPVSAAAAAAVASGARSLRDLLQSVQIEQIPASEWRTLDPRTQTLWDVDDSAELERMRESLR